MDRQAVLAALQHTPLPERMANFQRTRAPQDAWTGQDSEWLIVEYKHLQAEVRFQVLLSGEQARFQTAQEGQVTPMQTVSLPEAGHLLRRDLLMILEDLEDEL